MDRLEKQGHFTLNESTNNMLDQYRLDIDNVAAFVEELCTVSPDVMIEKQKLYDAYSNWCFNSGYKAEGLKKFYSRIETGFTVTTTRPYGKARAFTGISITWNK